MRYNKTKVYVLLRDLPNLRSGAEFWQSITGKTYFHGLPVKSIRLAGIIEFNAADVEDNPDWFARKLNTAG